MRVLQFHIIHQKVFQLKFTFKSTLFDRPGVLFVLFCFEKQSELNKVACMREVCVEVLII